MKRIKIVTLLSVFGFGLAVFPTGCKKEVLPVANFTIAPETVVQYDMVTFTNMSKDADSYMWDFGDGTSSTDENPTKIYKTVGSFTVTLKATNGDGDESFEQTIAVAAPDNNYMLGSKKVAITTQPFWYTSPMGGDPYIRLISAVDGQANPDLLKV